MQQKGNEKEYSAVFMRTVFSVLNLALNTLSGTHEGKGKECGVTFVVGDSDNVMRNSTLKSGEIDPIEELEEKFRNINSTLFNAWLFSKLPNMEAGIVVTRDGRVLGTNRYFDTKVTHFGADGDGKGGGSRHAAAKSITTATDSISIVKSSENYLTVYVKGQLMLRATPYVLIRPTYIAKSEYMDDDPDSEDDMFGSELWDRLCPAFNQVFPDYHAIYDIDPEMESIGNQDMTKRRTKFNVMRTISLRQMEELVRMIEEEDKDDDDEDDDGLEEEEEIFQDLVGEVGVSIRPWGCLRDKWYHNIRKSTLEKEEEDMLEAQKKDDSDNWDRYIH